VTIDAMGTQTKMAQEILDGGGDHLLSQKENWPATYAEVVMLLNNPPPGTVFETHRTVDGCNGRIATRRYTVCYDIDWMMSDRRYPGEPKFPGLVMIGRVETEVERGGKVVYEPRHNLCSTKLTAEMFGQAVHGHWGIENCLHWDLDMVFREDLARLRSGNTPANMAMVRHAALTLLSRAKPITSFKNRRKRAGWNTDFLETVIRGAA
jgi:predicted transposase YbfD/YdcC